jgi:hypothetical protein
MPFVAEESEAPAPGVIEMTQGDDMHGTCIRRSRRVRLEAWRLTRK